MGFKQAVKTCFSKFATFEGRARRSEFWFFYLFLQLVGIVGYLVLLVVFVIAGLTPLFLSGTSEETAMAGLGVGLIVALVVFGIFMIATLVLMIPYLAVSARRLHDMGQSAHWLWLHLIGFGIVPVIMAFFDSQWGPNQWGPDPKAHERAMYAPAQPAGYAGQPQYDHPQYGQPYTGQQAHYGEQPPTLPPAPPAQ